MIIKRGEFIELFLMYSVYEKMCKLNLNWHNSGPDYIDYWHRNIDFKIFLQTHRF